MWLRISNNRPGGNQRDGVRDGGMASKVLAHATALLNDLVAVVIRQERMVRIINRLAPLDGRREPSRQ